MSVKIFAVGDVMGKPGRQAVEHFLPQIESEIAPDFKILNGENSAGGFGITRKIFDQFLDSFKFNAITMGNHWHDKPEVFSFKTHEALVIPGNMENVEVGRFGMNIFQLNTGPRVCVMNLIGQKFMKGENRNIFETIDYMLERIPDSIKIRVIDIHAEATSEKQALARYVDGRVSLVYGTHSHVPTLDDRIFTQGTGFVTDLGMTGPYDSVIGIRTEAAILRMRTGVKKKFEPATSDLRVYAIAAEIDEETGRCTDLKRICWKKAD